MEKSISQTENGEIKEIDLSIEEMARAGLHFGHRASMVHPKMTPYLSKIRDSIRIINLEKTREKLKEALKFIKELIIQNKILLLIGTKIQLRNLVKETAIECGLPYISERWLGGTFTNFEVMKKRINFLKELEEKLNNKGVMDKYTKKEKAKMEKELERLKLKFEGIRNLERLPDAIFVLDIKKDGSAVKEARKKGIKVIGITDTNVDPTLTDYPIPANDDAISSVRYILGKVKEVILKAKSEITKKINN